MYLKLQRYFFRKLRNKYLKKNLRIQKTSIFPLIENRLKIDD